MLPVRYTEEEVRLWIGRNHMDCQGEVHAGDSYVECSRRRAEDPVASRGPE
jgi:hypothetical protein